MNKHVWRILGVFSLLTVSFFLFYNVGEDPLREKVHSQKSVSGVERLIVADANIGDLPEIRKRKKLRALVPYSRSDFTILANGEVQGFQVELLKQYESMINKGIKREVDKTHIVWIPTAFDRLIPDLLLGKGDVAAALLSVTPERLEKVNFATASGLIADELLVVSKDVTGISRIEDLSGREVYVLKGSSYEEHLREINASWQGKGLKAMVIKSMDKRLLSEDLLKMVHAGMLAITVVDDYKAYLWKKVLPNIRVLENIKIKEGNRLGWAVRKNNPILLKSMNHFAASVKKGTLMGNMLFQRYFNASWIKRPLAEDEQSKVQKLMPVFSKYAKLYNYDALALIAQAYQESHLNNQRKSHRGAVGIMQLLPSTAAGSHVGMSDISSIEDNIHAGVKYLAFLRDRYFSDPAMSEVDRLAFIWAAYNAGPAKVIKMRRLAKEMGLNPNIWFDHVELAAAKLVGRETVHYVRSIFTHYIAYGLVRERFASLSQPSQE
ncbi:transporter substrate-binding domain-containing protein [Mariprofundus ferrooxydans]|nr:transporter substrate-binding domain-containing protein [Mariprofundus ferrooxydans]